ncbi:Gfo/Idh/MocA family protein [Candidatus Zixiibacteriota bacterium]
MVRFGIVGFGLHAVKRLMPGFSGSERCEVTALSRRDPEKAKQSADEFTIPHTFTSTTDLCASGQIDAVFVASPDALHLSDVLTAIEHRIPVLCEKPLAMNSGEARQMVAAASDADVLFGVAHIFRFEESVRRFRERIEQGDIGRPLFARAEFHYPGLSSPRAWLNDPAMACGGPIADVGIHCIDVLRHILQDEIREVNTTAIEDEQSRPFEARALLTLTFSRGVLATVAVSTRRAYRTLLEVIGEDGMISADDAMNVERPVTIKLQRTSGVEVVENEVVSNLTAYTRQVDAFAEAVTEESEFAVPGEEGIKNQLVLDALFRSRTSGQAELVEDI